MPTDPSAVIAELERTLSTTMESARLDLLRAQWRLLRHAGRIMGLLSESTPIGNLAHAPILAQSSDRRHAQILTYADLPLSPHDLGGRAVERFCERNELLIDDLGGLDVPSVVELALTQPGSVRKVWFWPHRADLICRYEQHLAVEWARKRASGALDVLDPTTGLSPIEALCVEELAGQVLEALVPSPDRGRALVYASLQDLHKRAMAAGQFGPASNALKAIAALVGANRQQLSGDADEAFVDAVRTKPALPAPEPQPE